MLFQIHSEGRIAYKRLSNADLKRSPLSHQTHIGLSIDSLTFMPDDKKEYSAMLIYKSFCDILSCEIAKIHRENGRYDAPKISMGNKDDNVVNKIRSYAAKSPNKDFYLIWFGLDSLTPVFWLLEEDSADYKLLDIYCNFDFLEDRKIVVLGRGDNNFSNILACTQSRIAAATENLQKELEISVEMEEDNPKFRDTEIKKAQNYIKELGNLGEALVEEYLQKKRHEKEILDFEWMNRDGEKGKPFDFFIKYANGLERWIDVKATGRKFDQAVIITKNEMRFITEKESSNYAIFRVYSLNEIQAKLRICSDCLRYIKKLLRDVDYMAQSMSDYKASLVSYNIAFEPGPNSFSDISEEIDIGGGTTINVNIQNNFNAPVENVYNNMK